MPAADPRSEGSRPRPSRRALATGAAWSVPAAALATAAPAVAASCEPCTNGQVLADHQSPGTYTLALNPCISTVSITVISAAGAPSAGYGGRGARLTARMTLPAGATTLTLVVGATGRERGTPMSNASRLWSTGYGSGGSGGTWTNPSTGVLLSDGGGGGGGSAVLIGDTPVAVVGGGGGCGNAIAFSGGGGSSGTAGEGGVSVPLNADFFYNERDGEDATAWGGDTTGIAGGLAAVGATGGAASTRAQPPETNVIDRGGAGADASAGGDGGAGGTGLQGNPEGSHGAGGGGGGYAGGSGGDAIGSLGQGHNAGGGSGGGSGSSYIGGGAGATLSGTRLVWENNSETLGRDPAFRDGAITVTCVS